MLDLSKPVRTKGSKTPVEIIANRPGLKYPIIGIVSGEDDYVTWKEGGIFHDEHSLLNLENIPEGK